MNRICAVCVLPEAFPGAKFNKQGVCNFCKEFGKENNFEEKKARYRDKFEKLLQEYRGKRAFDGLVGYSGGKDSTYTLALLKEEYGMNLLALTFDNGFLPGQTYTNIRNVVETLSVDHIFIKPGFKMLQKIFREGARKNIFSSATLTRASTICTSCMALVRFSSLRLALEKGIPFLIFGWSPGQIPLSASIMRNNSSMVRAMQEPVYGPLENLAGREIRPFFLEEEHFRRSYFYPYNISPLAFLDYDESEIKERVSRLGWKRPVGVDANSSNCLLNSFANVMHKEQHGFNPYVFELAKLVREGYLERGEALAKLDQPEDRKTVDSVKRKLFS